MITVKLAPDASKLKPAAPLTARSIKRAKWVLTGSATYFALDPARISATVTALEKAQDAIDNAIVWLGAEGNGLAPGVDKDDGLAALMSELRAARRTR